MLQLSHLDLGRHEEGEVRIGGEERLVVVDERGQLQGLMVAHFHLQNRTVREKRGQGKIRGTEGKQVGNLK